MRNANKHRNRNMCGIINDNVGCLQRLVAKIQKFEHIFLSEKIYDRLEFDSETSPDFSVFIFIDFLKSYNSISKTAENVRE